MAAEMAGMDRALALPPQLPRPASHQEFLVHEQWWYVHDGRPGLCLQFSRVDGDRAGLLRCIGSWHGVRTETSWRVGMWSRGPRHGMLTVEFRYRKRNLRTI